MGRRLSGKKSILWAMKRGSHKSSETEDFHEISISQFSEISFPSMYTLKKYNDNEYGEHLSGISIILSMIQPASQPFIYPFTVSGYVYG